MFKWILIVMAIVGAGAFVYQQRNATKVSYVNGLAAYNRLPNQEYIFQRDCYIFKLRDMESAYPYVGTREIVPALPEKVEPALVGKTVGDARILDVVRVGDRFRIVSVRREKSRKSSFVTFEILLENEAARKYPRLDAYFILQHPADGEETAPQVLETFAVRRVKG
ncbi:MAG TPA: hypothetical protein VHF69_13585 [Candidatus Synoicihabitans sp.]|nr:hypothetical protein [Candidatus Synoicihabitans sp.]